MNPYTTTELPGVLIVTFEKYKKGWNQKFLLTSDRHHDSVYSNRDLELRHLQQAKEEDALILDAGDVFDAMQGHYDPRKSMAGVRDEDKKENYLQTIVKHAEEFYSPFAKNWLSMGYGNHETSILKHNDYDLIQALTDRIEWKTGHRIYRGGFDGWILFRMRGNKNRQIPFYYRHAKGGPAPVTKGVIGAQRLSTEVPDAKVTHTGHNHESWLATHTRFRVFETGKTYFDVQYHVRTPSYNIEFRDKPQRTGFAVEKGTPTPTGCVWMTFKYQKGEVKITFEHDVE